MADSGLIQENRLVAVQTPLGKDKLIFRSMRVSEALGRPFEIHLELLSADFEISFAKLLGENVTIRVDPERGKDRRFFNGYVSEFSHVGSVGQYASYRAVLRPWLWFLTRNADCRIYQEMTIPEIVESVFAAHGFNDYEMPQGSFRKWTYCVQYRETDFNFVSRLLEQEGIYYHFAHENGKHTMKLCTPDSSKKAFPGYKDIPFFREASGAYEEGSINSWELTRVVQPTAFALDDYDFEKSGTPIDGDAKLGTAHGGGKREIYDYPGEYATSSDAKTYAKIRIEEVQAEYERVYASGNTRGIACGHVFNLKGEVLRKDQLREYLVVAAEHMVTVADVESGMGDGGVEYACRFEAMESKAPFRPARVTPKPVVQGPQTGVVVGPSGEEIHTDKYGRIKVKFRWDRHNPAGDEASCWIRVSQSMAGRAWGSFVLPRIGQEVLVEFLEGDPDRPIVTGSLYNDAHQPPFDLPADKSKLGLKTDTTKGGGGFNELSFDDSAGKEQIVVHGQKDMHIRVLHDRHETILNDRHLIVGDKKESGKGNRIEYVNNDEHVEIVNDRIESIGRNVSLKVGGNVGEDVGGDHSDIVGGDFYVKAGANIVLEAQTNITLKVGGSSVVIDNTGITIKTNGTLEGQGTMVAIEGKTKVDIKAKAMATVDGGGMTMVKGGLVKIN